LTKDSGLDRAVISTRTDSSLNAGDMYINDFDLVTINDSWFFSETTSLGAAGSINFTNIGSLIINAGSIFTRSRGSGDAGTIVINADLVEVNSRGTNFIKTAMISSTTTSDGNAGRIEINTGSLLMTGGIIETVSLDTFDGGGGNAGDIVIIANVIEMNPIIQKLNIGEFPFSSSINSISSQGKAGQIDITTSSLLVFGSSIASASFGVFDGGSAGDAGDINITAYEIDFISGRVISTATGRVNLGNTTSGTNNGGNITISSTGDPGSSFHMSLFFTAFNNCCISQSNISASIENTLGNAGKISIIGFDMVTLTDSFIASSSMMTVINGVGNAGTIEIIDVANLVLDLGSISVSSSGFGDTGAIDINVGDITLLNGSSITAEFNSELENDRGLVSPVEPTNPDLVAGDITIAALTSNFIMSGGSFISTNTNPPQMPVV